MSKLPLLSALELCKFLEKQDFVAIRQKGATDFMNILMAEQLLFQFIVGKTLAEGC